MTKRYFHLSAVTIGIVATSWASDLTPEQALARFNESKPIHTHILSTMSTDNSKQTLELEYTVGNLYVFTCGQGFVVLPAEDAAPALLAYSDTGNFELDTNPGLAYWMDYYNNELEYLKATGATSDYSKTAMRVSRPEIKPLTTTEWNQEYPYNELCPKVDGHETVTGCVATAMAQIMKYHNYPLHGKGSHSYLWRPGEEELSFDYENTTFQWDLMTDRYDSKSTDEERHAVARLMLACGISVDMHYEPGESGAATTLMGEALIDIFNYSPSLWMPNRVFYGYDEWENMIYADLAEGLPVLYSGAGTAGGHQFICDGYSSDGFFHFNWGWGGLSNGYFLLTALNPDDLGVGGGAGGFNSSQIATLGVRPPRPGDRPVYVIYNTEAFRTDAPSVKAHDDFSCTGLYFNYSLSKLPDDCRLGLKFVNESDNSVEYADGPSVADIDPEYGRRNIEVKFPELPDGKYRITPALYADGTWSDVRMPVGYPSQITAEVTNNEATISNQTAASIKIDDIKLPSAIYQDREFPMPFNVINTGNDEYYGSVTPLLIDAKGNIAAKSKFRPIDVTGGDNEDVADYIADFTAEDGHEFPAGEYSLVFRDEVGREVSSPVTVNVEILTGETEIKVSSLRLDGADLVTTPEDVKFTFTVSCESGAYFDSLRLLVFPGDGGIDIYNKSSDRFYLIAGETAEITITADLAHLDNGEYIAAVYKGDDMASEIIRFRIDTSAGVIIINMDESTSAGTVYDLKGIHHQSVPTTGVYIINGKKTLIRH